MLPQHTALPLSLDLRCLPVCFTCGRPVPPCIAAKAVSSSHRFAAIGHGIVVVAETGANARLGAELRGRQEAARFQRAFKGGTGRTDGRASLHGLHVALDFGNATMVSSAGGATLLVAAALERDVAAGSAFLRLAPPPPASPSQPYMTRRGVRDSEAVLHEAVLHEHADRSSRFSGQSGTRTTF